MAERLVKSAVSSEAELIQLVYSELNGLTQRELSSQTGNQEPLKICCASVWKAGAVTLIIQKRVHDPDFLAEYGAYYSKQFLDVPRFCTRIHFFGYPSQEIGNVLAYLDQVPTSEYLGFITLRPVINSPIGASILSSSKIKDRFICSADRFPVHLGGVEFSVNGTPFMQQDNAVGACAQASIWMALRTLRKKEGDRAYDPAQITDAATRYLAHGRVRPNRQGLTQLQIVEAVRAAGYSPHSIPLGSWLNENRGGMNENEITESMKVIHAYIESEIPVLLILFHPTGGHAVVAIGHTWQASPIRNRYVHLTLPNGLKTTFAHATSWIPSFIVHNDNTGPYRELLPASEDDYSLTHAAFAIPLLPADVFMSGEEAFTLAAQVLAEIFGGIKNDGIKNDEEIRGITNGLALRLLLVEKRKLRRWAAKETMPPELKQHLRLMELPKRVWILEIHLASDYGDQKSDSPSLIGFILIDPTADILTMSVLLFYFNLPLLIDPSFAGIMMTWDINAGLPQKVIKTTEAGPIMHISNKLY